jgi:transposase
MASYSLDLRKRIIDAVEGGVGSKRALARLFGVDESFIYKLLRQKRERGDLAPLPHGGGARAKLTEPARVLLAELVGQTPDATLAELGEELKKKARIKVSPSTVCRGLQALGLTRKKRPNSLPKQTQLSVRPSGTNKKRCPSSL